MNKKVEDDTIEVEDITIKVEDITIKVEDITIKVEDDTIEETCQHEFIDDYIDLTTESGKNIKYCKYCFLDFYHLSKK